MSIKSTVEFERQCTLVQELLEQWNNQCRRVFLEKLLSKCSGSQLEFLFSVTEPLHHRGFIYSTRHQLANCPPISTPSSRHEALLFALENVSEKFYRPKSAVLKSKDDIDKLMTENASVYSVLTGGLFKTLKSKKSHVSKRDLKEIQMILTWYEGEWSDTEKLDILYIVLCSLTSHELYHATLMLNLRRYRDFITKLPLHLTLKILAYLMPYDIVNSSEVSREWHEICTSDLTWNMKCLQYSVPQTNTDGLSQKVLFKNNVLLKKNWQSGRCGVVCFSGSPHKLVSVAYDPRTGKIATGMLSGEIRIWTLAKTVGTLISSLYSHTKSVWVVEWFKPNCLISCSSDGTIKIWNVKKALCQKSIDAHEGKIWTLKCDYEVIFSGSDDKTIKCWDIKRCEVVQSYIGHTGSVFCLDLSGDTLLISGSADKTVRVWDRESGDCLRSIWVTHVNPGWVMGLSVSQGHVACCYNEKVAIYHLNTGVLVKTLQSHSQGVERVKMRMKAGSHDTKVGSHDSKVGSHDTGTLVTCSKDNNIHYWNLESGELHKLEGHKGSVYDIAMTADKIVSVSADNTLKLWKFSYPNDPSIRRKTLISGGSGQLFLYEYHYDENVQYESKETQLYKKQLSKMAIRKGRKLNKVSDEGSREVTSSLSDVTVTSSFTPVEVK